MPNNRPDKKQLGDLAKQIQHDQVQASPAEKRVKVDSSFESAVKKMGQTPPPEKADK